MKNLKKSLKNDYKMLKSKIPNLKTSYKIFKKDISNK